MSQQCLVCMYVFMYVCIYICMYVSIYVCMYLSMYVCFYVCMCVCMTRQTSYRPVRTSHTCSSDMFSCFIRGHNSQDYTLLSLLTCTKQLRCKTVSKITNITHCSPTYQYNFSASNYTFESQAQGLARSQTRNQSRSSRPYKSMQLRNVQLFHRIMRSSRLDPWITLETRTINSLDI